MLDPNVVGQEHYEVAREAQRLLQAYRDLQDIIAILGIDELSEEQKQTVARARRLQRFMSQPFFVAEVFTGREGKYVPIKDTVASFKEILDGKTDDLPEQAFFLAGTIDDVRENAGKRMTVVSARGSCRGVSADASAYRRPRDQARPPGATRAAATPRAPRFGWGLGVPLLLEIVTPERQVFSEEVDSVVCPGIEGELGVLPHHAPLLTTLGVGELRIRRGGEEEFFAIAGGFVQVRPDKVVVMAETADMASEIDLEKAAGSTARSGTGTGRGLRGAG